MGKPKKIEEQPLFDLAVRAEAEAVDGAEWGGGQPDWTIDARFDRFMVECPDVYPLFVQHALDLVRRGVTHYSADAICHVIRFHRITAGRDSAGYKVNNVFTALLARKAMAEHPAELGGFFETRQRKSE